MSVLSRRQFLGFGSAQRRAQHQAPTSIPRAFLEDFYANRGRQAEVPLVFHPTIAVQDGGESMDDEDRDERE